MIRKMKYVTSCALISAMLLTGCSSATGDTLSTTINSNTTLEEAIISTSSEIVVDTEFSAKDLEVGYDESSATQILLEDNNITIIGTGAEVKDSVITISKEGTYVFTGAVSNGRIVVDAADTDKIQLVLNGVNINSSDHAPIYVKSADKVFITLQESTVNTLTDGTAYVQTDENTVDGVIFSMADLSLNGEGTLKINGNYKHGIISKDELVFTGGAYQITAVKDAINGKDCVKIKDGTFTLNAATGNGIQSKNGDNTTTGYVYITGGTITVESSVEGIEGTAILVEGGTIDITASDDGFNASSGDTTASETVSDTVEETTSDPTTEALSNNSTETVSNNSIITLMSTTTEAAASLTTDVTTANTVTAADVTANTPVATSTVTLSEDATVGAPDTNSSAILPENVTADTPDASSSATLPEDATAGAPDANSSATVPEGKEGKIGKGGSFGSGFGGGGEMENDANCYISISGGTITMNASGDGIDTNGSLYISGGEIYVSGPTENMNAGMDYNGTAEITGGTIVVAGSIGMAQGFSDTSSQYSILYNLTSPSTGDTEVSLADENGNVIVSFTPDKDYQSVVISSKDLENGKTYKLTSGDQTADITLSSIVTSNVQAGEGMMGGRGQGGMVRPGQDGSVRPGGGN